MLLCCFSHYFLKALLDYSCYDDKALRWLENTIKRLIKNKNVPSPDAMISWCKENRCLDPHTVTKVLHCTLYKWKIIVMCVFRSLAVYLAYVSK